MNMSVNINESDVKPSRHPRLRDAAAARLGRMLRSKKDAPFLESSSVGSSESSKRCSPVGNHARRDSKREPAVTAGLMGRLRHTILDDAQSKRSNHKKRVSSSMQHPQGREMREKWLEVERELRNVQGLTSVSVQATTTVAQMELLHNMRMDISSTTHCLLEGHSTLAKTNEEKNPFRLKGKAYEDDTHVYRSREPTGLRKGFDVRDAEGYRYFVWSSSQAARCALVQEVVKLSNEKWTKHPSVLPTPLIILAVEAMPGIDVGSGCERFIADTENFSETSHVLTAWGQACFGLAELAIVEAEFPHRMRSRIEAELEKSYDNPLLDPVLVCCHTSWDSVLTSEMGNLRRACDEYKAYLCAEGTALSLVAQPDRPSDPDECVRSAHILLLDPGSWFGFNMCGVVTRHESDLGRERLQQSLRIPFTSSLPALNATDNDYKHGIATGHVLNLWTVLHKMGIDDIRSRVERVTALAECFVHCLQSSSNIDVEYNGIGCVVRISYGLRREERLVDARRSGSHISVVNDTIFSALGESLHSLMVYKVIVDTYSFLQFSPARVLASETFWIPQDVEVRKFASQIQETVDRYEACKAGQVAFQSMVAKCRDLSFVTTSEMPSADRALSFGAFRLIPFEVQSSWEDLPSTVELVTSLTHSLVLGIRDSAADIIVGPGQQRRQERSRIAEALPSQTRNMIIHCSLAKSGYEDLSSEGDDFRNELPVAMFLNSQLEKGVTDYISIEPKESCSPLEAVDQAEVAADFIVKAVNTIVWRWRSSDWTPPLPSELQNLSGAPVPELKASSGDDCSALSVVEQNDPVDYQPGENAHNFRTSEEYRTDMEPLCSSAYFDPAGTEKLYETFDEKLSGRSGLSSDGYTIRYGRDESNFSPPASEDVSLMAPQQIDDCFIDTGSDIGRLRSGSHAYSESSIARVAAAGAAVVPNVYELARNQNTNQGARWVDMWRADTGKKSNHSRKNNRDESDHSSEENDSFDQSGRRSGDDDGDEADRDESGGSSSDSESSHNDETSTDTEDEDTVEGNEEYAETEESSGRPCTSTSKSSRHRSGSEFSSDEAEDHVQPASNQRGLLGWMRRGTPEPTSSVSDRASGSDATLQGRSDGTDTHNGESSSASLTYQSVDVNTQQSEVPTERTSQGSGFFVDEDSDSTDGGDKKAQHNDIRTWGPNIFGFNWFRWRQQASSGGGGSEGFGVERSLKRTDSAKESEDSKSEAPVSRHTAHSDTETVSGTEHDSRVKFHSTSRTSSENEFDSEAEGHARTEEGSANSTSSESKSEEPIERMELPAEKAASRSWFSFMRRSAAPIAAKPVADQHTEGGVESMSESGSGESESEQSGDSEEDTTSDSRIWNHSIRNSDGSESESSGDDSMEGSETRSASEATCSSESETIATTATSQTSRTSRTSHTSRTSRTARMTDTSSRSDLTVTNRSESESNSDDDIGSSGESEESEVERKRNRKGTKGRKPSAPKSTVAKYFGWIAPTWGEESEDEEYAGRRSAKASRTWVKPESS